jgi:2,4'-dihydroxyacetophenone dioxygenase
VTKKSTIPIQLPNFLIYDIQITLFHVTGALLYCDPDGKVTGAEDVFTKLELAKKHYKDIGLGEDFVQQFVR